MSQFLCRSKRKKFSRKKEVKRAGRKLIMMESLICLIIFVIMMAPQAGGCQTLFVFGDTNSDTGFLAPAGRGEVGPPHGETFFGHPAGRYCDGRLIVDFIAEKLKLPYLSPYMEIGANFSHGVNFAFSGSHIIPIACVPGDSLPFHLFKQVSQFFHFKGRTTALYNALSSKEPDEVFVIESTFPKPMDFPEALYIIDIGQNDLLHLLKEPEEVIGMILSQDIGNVSDAIQRLAKEGARYFRVHNTGPIGCLPSTIANFTSNDLDQYGCVQSANKIAQEFNKELKDMLSELRKQLSNTSIVYVDMYTAKYELVATAEKEGFGNPTIACCPMVNGAPNYENACKQPWKYISWDGTQYTEAANHWVANRILDDSLSDPPLSIEKACLPM